MKYFITSDIHSYCPQWIMALENAGFDIEDPDQKVVINGDLFDRGKTTRECLEYAKLLQKKGRLIYIKGNHEQLLELLLKKDFPQSYDYSNGTVRTCCDLAKIDFHLMDPKYWFTEYIVDNDIPESQSGRILSGAALDLDSLETQRKMHDYTYKNMSETWKKIVKKVKDLCVVEWINTSCINYLELGNYIITHCFIPVMLRRNHESTGLFDLGSMDTIKKYRDVPGWRIHANEKHWDDARWGAPHKMMDAGLFDREIANGKTLVCGHWWAYDIRNYFENTNTEDHSIYFGKNIIGIDTCTPSSHKVNVLIIEDKDGKVEILNKK